MSYNVLLSRILRGSILVIGILGNTIGLIIFSRKAFKNFPSRYVYIALALIDTFNLIFAIVRDLLISPSNYWSNLFVCKTFMFIAISFGATSPWLLVFISVEKFISIRLPNFKLFRQQSFQTAIVLAIILFNLVYNNPFIYSFTFVNQSKNITVNISQFDFNHQVICYYDENKRKLATILNLINSSLVPFLFMVIFSVLLVHTIMKSRLRVLRMSSNHDQSRLRKDIQFAISSVAMNLFFLLFTFPFKFGHFLSNDPYTDLFFNLIFFLFYLSFCDNFYILFFLNKIFNKQVFILFGLKQQLQPISQISQVHL